VFCDYFDPDNLHDAYRVIARLITDPDHRRNLEQRIEREFRPPSWADSAVAILSTLRPTPMPVEAARPLLVAE
jgi:hypothetical protein